MIVSNGEAAGAVFGEAGEAIAHALADRFERLKTGGALCGMDAGALGGTVIDRGEHRELFAEREARRRHEKEAEEQLKRKKQEELEAFKRRLENFQLTD
jgi:hypothetical protein